MSEPVNNLLRGLAPDQRRRITNALMADQYNRPTPQDGPVTERAGMFPLGTYANGQTGIAWPGFIAQPVESFVNLLQRGYQGGTGDTQGVEDAFNVAGGAMTGGLLAPRPRGSVGMSGRITQAGETPKSALPSRLSEGSAGPTPQPFGQTAGGQPVPVLSRPGHLQGPAPHTTIEDDLLPSASFAPWSVEGYNITANDIGPMRQALQEQFVGGTVPEGWYVHGRANRGDLDTGNVTQATQNPDVALRYAGRADGSVWAMRPLPDTRVLDFTSDATPDVRKTTAKALVDYRSGTLPFDQELTGTTGRELSQQIRQAFTPENIVNDAGAFDSINWVNWLAERTRAGFIRTPDGAVAMSPEDVQAVRLFSNGGLPGASLGVVNSLLQGFDYQPASQPQSPHDWTRKLRPGDI